MQEFIQKVENVAHRQHLTELYEMIQADFPQLKYEVKWNQPMFTDHGTYIIGFSVSKDYVNIAPEIKTMEKFAERIKGNRYAQTKNYVKIGVKDTIDMLMIKEMIQFNILDKAECQTFWR